MNTATTTTTTPVVVTTADSKVVAAISTWSSALEKLEGGYNNIAKETGKVAARMGLTTSAQVSDLLRLSFFEQAKLTDASDTDKADYLDTVKSDISNLTTLVLPRPVSEGKGKDAVILKSTEELIAARDKAWSYNDGLPKGCRRNLRIGQKSVLAIVRGIEDVDYIIGVKNGTIKPKVSEPSAASVNGPASANNPTSEASGDVTSQPEAQNAEVPAPQADGQKPISSPRDLLRASIRNLSTVFSTTHGLTVDVIKEIIADELSKM